MWRRLFSGRRWVVLAVALALHCAAPHLVLAAEAETVARFCAVPVLDGAPTEADHGDAWRIVLSGFSIPGLPGPVFTPMNRGGQWTVDAERRLVPYEGLFPHTYLDLDNWVVEPWSGRILAATFRGALSVLRPGTDRFAPIGGQTHRYHGVHLMPRLRMTLALRTDGIPLVVGDADLMPWTTPDELSAVGVAGVERMYDSPLLGATVVRDRERRLHALADEGGWHPLTRLARHETGSMQDLPRSGIALLTTGRSLIAFRRHGRGADARFSAEHLPVDDNRHWRSYWRSSLFGELLHVAGGGWFEGRERWRWLTPAGFADIPGGEIGLIAGERGHAPSFSARDLPWLGVALLGGEEGFYLYDGRGIRPLPGGRWDGLGGRGFPRALPSIRQVLVAASAGMFRLADGTRLEPWSPPAGMTSVFDSFDWPEAGVALLKTADGLYALDATLGTEKVMDTTGFAALGVGNPTRNPATGELVLAAREGLFLVVDRRHPGAGGCQRR